MSREINLILESDNGKLTAEVSGVPSDLLTGLNDDLGTSLKVNCGKPLQRSDVNLPASAAYSSNDNQSVWLYRLYHNSVVDGPGRRSVIQVSGCSIKCPGCYVPETHSRLNGKSVPISNIVSEILKEKENNDGVTILGGEPFDQAPAVSGLVAKLKSHGLNVVVYSGYPIETLIERRLSSIDNILTRIDLLIDGPFINKIREDSGEYRGSRNQRIINLNDLRDNTHAN